MKKKLFYLSLFLVIVLALFRAYSPVSLPSGVDAREEFRKRADAEKLAHVRELGRETNAAAVKDFLVAMYPDEPASEHELAHVIGETAFNSDGYGGFDVCDSFMRFGCYHGVILEAIKQRGYNQEVMLNLAEGCLTLDRNRTTVTACVHGIGHGIMWIKSYDLLESYKECDSMFTDSIDRFFCHDGVSMENVVRRSDGEVAFDNLTSTDPYYPCNTVPTEYQAACVREHVHYVRREFYNKETEKVADYCRYFTQERARSECFGALGNALNQDFPQEPQKIITECLKLGQYSVPCISVAATQYAFGHDNDNAERLCAALSDQFVQAGCRSSVDYARASL